MKKVNFLHYITILTMLVCPSILAKESLKSDADFLTDISHYQLYIDEVDLKKDKLDLLTLVKINLIAGDITKAQYFLGKIQKPTKDLQKVMGYYQALIYFIQNNFQQSYDSLDHEHFYSTSSYPNVCVTKIVTLLAITTSSELDKNKLRSELLRCRVRTQKYTKNHHYWIKTLSLFRTDIDKIITGRQLNDFRYVLTDKETVQLWLKAGLILGKEEVIKKYIIYIGEDFYRYSSVRELIGMVYFRLGENDKALKFIEDLDSPNAENIKGFISIDNNQLELALGHFQLALKKKQNSFNALSKGLALSWLLEQWQLGSNMLNQLQGAQLKWQHKYAFRAAFMAQLGNYKELSKIVTLLEKEYPRLRPTEVQLLRSFNGAISDNQLQFEDGSHEACKNHDGISCWLSHKIVQDQSFSYSMKRADPLFEDLNIDLDALKSSVSITPLKEIPLIYQKDIEELDSNDVDGKGLLLKNSAN